jgi:hypothetical protein
MTEHVTGTRRGGRLAGAGALAVIAAACTLVVSTARPAEATSLGTRWGGTVDFHMIRVTRSPLVANPGSTAQWQEETVEASVHWRFDQPPPKSRAPDDLVKDVNARGRARASAGDHVVSTDPDGSADCYAPAREDASGTASFDDLVEIDYAYDPDPAKKGWNLLLGIDDEFPYNKPPYQPRGVDQPRPTRHIPGCDHST